MGETTHLDSGHNRYPPAEFRITTDPKFPGQVYMHFYSGGFSFCHSMAFEDAALTSLALRQAAEKAEKDKADANGGKVEAA